LHAAACLRTPAVGVFGPTLPQLFYEEKYRAHFAASRVDCAGCHHRVPRLHWITGCPHDIKCMKSISPEEVLLACRAVLQSESRPGRLQTFPQ
jgi:ADP-heptose:LPS heptosyltransferase